MASNISSRTAQTDISWVAQLNNIYLFKQHRWWIVRFHCNLPSASEQEHDPSYPISQLRVVLSTGKDSKRPQGAAIIAFDLVIAVQYALSHSTRKVKVLAWF